MNPVGSVMLQETPDEFHDIEDHGPPAGAPRLSVAKSDGSILHLDNAAVGDGHLENIGSEILEAGGACAYRLAVDVPLSCPHINGDHPFEAGGFDGVSGLGPEAYRSQRGCALQGCSTPGCARSFRQAEGL
jgi:hypothetical protein